MRVLYIDIDGERRKCHTDTCGYQRFKFRGKSLHLHRWLAEEFLARPPGNPQVNHKDGNKQNNSLQNLEWVTQRENLHHAMDSGLHAWGRNTTVGVDVETGVTVSFASQTEAAKVTGAGQPNISAVLRGRRRTAAGIQWV